MRIRQLISLASVFAFSLLLAGCATSFDPLVTSAPATSKIGAISGTVFGGRQPIVGERIFVFAVGTGGYGGNGIAASSANASSSLLTNSSAAGYQTAQDTTAGSPTFGDYYVTTVAGGAFSLSGEYTCTQNTQVYLYGVGGDPGSGANSAAALMAVLGNCPVSGTLGSQVPTVYMNEVSTIAAAYALAGFATDPIHISSANTALAKTGVANAAANAAQMYNLGDYHSVARTSTPNSGTNGGTGTVPNLEINTLGNILASCVNTTGPSSANCLTLFRNATSDGVTCATTCTDEPTDTAAAAINIAHHPGANASTTPNNVSALYGLVGGTGVPYSPPLSSQPNDFSVQISFTGGGLTPQFTNGVGLAVDASGNIWVANGQDSAGDAGPGTTLSKFNPLGVPANTSGYTGGTNQLNLPYGLAISADSAHVWIGNYGHSSVVDFNVAAGTGTEYVLPSGAGALSLAFDSSGNLWAPDDNNIKLLKMNTSGTVLNTYAGNGMVSPDAIAISPTSTGKVWLADSNGSFEVFTSAGAAVSNPSIPNQSESVALDSAGNAWTVSSMSTGGSVFKMNASGSGSTNFSPSCISGSDLYGAAMDGGNNLWITGQDNTSHNVTNNRICAVNNSGVVITGVGLGFAPTPSNTTQPSAIAVDGSGNVWYTSSSSDKTLHEIVGAGVPVATPVAYGVANSLLGTRP